MGMGQPRNEAKCIEFVLGKLHGKRPPGEARFEWEDVTRGSH